MRSILLLFVSTNPTDSSTDDFVNPTNHWLDRKLILLLQHSCTDAKIVNSIYLRLPSDVNIVVYSYSSPVTAVKYYCLENNCLVSLLSIFLIDTLYCHYCSVACRMVNPTMMFGRNIYSNIFPNDYCHG